MKENEGLKEIWYEAALQTDRPDIIKFLDKGAGKGHACGFVPTERKLLQDGSMICQWIFREESGRDRDSFLNWLKNRFLWYQTGRSVEREQLTYKLIIMDNTGKAYQEADGYGDALFRNLYVVRGIAYPAGWYQKGKS